MQIPITGPAYIHASQDVNYQRCVNQYPIEIGPDGRGVNSTLIPSPGRRSVLEFEGVNNIRGILSAFGFLYVVAGDTVFKYDLNPITGTVNSEEEIGTLQTDSGLVVMAYSETQLMIVDNPNGYVYDFESGDFEQIVLAAFAGASYVVFLQGYFIVCNPASNRMQHSGLNDATSWDPLDFATAEARPDNIVGLASNRGELWVFGETSVEVWDNTANPTGFAFTVIEGAGMDTGCSAAHSITDIDNRIMWMDNRGRVVLSDASKFIRNNNTGYTIITVSTDALNKEFSSYDTLADIVAIQYTDRGHLMWQMTSPNANKTWVYDYTTNLWHERSYFDATTGRETFDIAQLYCKLGNSDIMAGVKFGKIYVSSPEILTDDGTPIIRLRSTMVFNDEFNIRVVDELLVRLQTGTVPPSGSGSDPVVSMRYSNNGGHSWSQWIPRSMGKVGEYAKTISWNRLGYGREWILEFKIVEPILYSIIDASARIR